ncbi:hypothetical protein SLEP1_g29613 [Rubroshorea leprosula]|uniref:Gnk2-homologous domain-containing protein n=1 Tax=Rubroshorea leprosula TaxID=152421 RepID=A0AAV5K811_9ROSI|nr:hypothetical protein SLEP1_g29613 [Rubroshorea leprosula]
MSAFRFFPARPHHWSLVPNLPLPFLPQYDQFYQKQHLSIKSQPPPGTPLPPYPPMLLPLAPMGSIIRPPAKTPTGSTVSSSAAAMFQGCLLRYFNASIFSTLSESESVSMWNAQNATDPTRFNGVVAMAMNDAVAEAVSAAKRFARKKANISAFQTLHRLVQCRPDPSTLGCSRCLQGAIASLPSCCSGKLLTGRGRKKYEIVQGYNAVADITTIESLQYDLNLIEAATNNFPDSNRLSEGGFGVVYKGRFTNVQEIAVKRFWTRS